MKKENLIVFDFDNTLVVSDSEVIVKKSDGKTLHLDPYEYAAYKKEPTDKFDFSQFEQLINPRQIEKYHKIMKAAIKSPKSDVLILSARGNSNIIRSYLRELNINDNEVEVIGLNSSNPEDKSNAIAQLIKNKEYKDVHMFDDSEHIEKALQTVKNSGARIHTHLVPKHHYQSLSTKKPREFDPNKAKDLLKTRVKNPMTGNNILVKTALKYDKRHPAHKAARQFIVRHHKQG